MYFPKSDKRCFVRERTGTIETTLVRVPSGICTLRVLFILLLRPSPDIFRFYVKGSETTDIVSDPKQVVGMRREELKAKEM